MVKKNTGYFITGLTIAVMSFPAAVLAGTSAEQILETMRRQYEKSIENIEDYVLVTDQGTSYHKKARDNGRPYFRSRIETDSAVPESATIIDGTDFFHPGVYGRLVEKAVYEGDDEIAGVNVHVLYINEIEGLMESSGDGSDDIEYKVEDLWMYIDSGTQTLRRLRFGVKTVIDGNERDLEMTVNYGDYRDVEGMMIPYKTVMTVAGIGEVLSDAEREEAEEGLREMERELEQMPPAQRQMVEEMMGGQLERSRRMLEEDRMEIETEVQEVRVNTGMEDF